MAGRIPQNFIDDLVSRADIVEVVNARVPLKKKGKEYTACCPFHNEKTPSFTVSDSKQFYHCFGCGAHGTALGFIMEYENLDFVDAVEALAAEYNLDVPRENSHFHSSESKDSKQPLYDILEKTAELFRQQLKTSDKAVQYLQQRGLTGEVAKTYQIGYAPNGWNFLTDNLGNDKTTVEALIATGLLASNDKGNQYDRFRDRIIFPITNRRGQVIGLGGRVIDQGEPKYLNSPENSVFHKGQELYGLYEARKAVRNLEHLIIVEGYMDVVALAQHGVNYAIASLGTATTSEQLQRAFRTVRTLIFCYDADQAGKKAAWRALENTLPLLRDGFEAKFLFLPEGEDPDSMIRQEGKDDFERRLLSAKPLSEFLFEHLCENINLESSEGKSALTEKAKPLLNKLPDSIFKELLFQELASRTGLDAGKLQASVADEPAHAVRVSSRPRSNREVKQNAIRDAVTLLLQFPALSSEVEIPDIFKTSALQGLPLLHEIARLIKSNPEIGSSALLERWRNNENFPTLQKLMQRDVVGCDEPQNTKAIFIDTIKNLISKNNDHRYEALEKKLQEEGLSDTELEEYKTHFTR
ncbi:MAG: DNA primase [Gammaproteobacteria bacterium]|jgi:DNA primase|nr:DNA primase [Gammaproteobacteria bacterium]